MVDEVVDGIRIRRTRKDVINVKDRKQEIADRVARFFEMDDSERTIASEQRLQRYAKFRQVRSGKSFPWPNASDTAVPDMMTQSLRTQDTLINAVMSSSPPVTALPLDEKARDKADNVDKMISYQVFNEQPGEKILGDFAESFVNDGVGTMFVSWVRDLQKTTTTKVFGKIEEGQNPIELFRAILAQEFPPASNDVPEQASEDGWDWTIDDKKVSFFTNASNRVEMVVAHEKLLFDGPRLKVYNWEDVYHPARAANLQPPAVHNPNGAGHVIVRDFISVGEIKKLIDNGFYDLVTEEEKNNIASVSRGGDREDMEIQKDDLQGNEEDSGRTSISDAEDHKTLTVWMCFDTFDIDDDGLPEQVVWWVIKETGILLKAARLSDQFPFSTLRRPFAETSYIPVEGRRLGISLLEMVEGLHDAQKILMDQMIDANTISTMPFFFYRAAGGVRPEVITMRPGDGYPVGDPKNDINIPTFNNQAVSSNVNIMTLLNGWEERLTLNGDLQFGRVPFGRSSALRTSSGIALLQNQGEARPERILRRFFIALTDMWSMIHDLNKVFLPEEKTIRVTKASRDDDPFQVIRSVEDLSGEFEFDFTANAFNTSKTALQESLGTAMSVVINPLMFQIGTSNADTVYRVTRDFLKAQGLDADQYLQKPTPESHLPRIMAEEAINQMINGIKPEGVPLESAQEHFAKLQEFQNSDQFGFLDEQKVTQLFVPYVQLVQQRVQQEIQQQQLAQAAQQMSAEMNQGQAGAPPQGAESPEMSTNQQPNQIMDRSLGVEGNA